MSKKQKRLGWYKSALTGKSQKANESTRIERELDVYRREDVLLLLGRNLEREEVVHKEKFGHRKYKVRGREI